MSFGSQGGRETWKQHQSLKLEYVGEWVPIKVCQQQNKPKPSRSQALNEWGDKGVKLQNIWGMWRRKSILEMNGRCTVWVEIAKWFKQVKWFEIVTCLRTLWIFSFFLLLQKLSLLETEASCRLWVTALQSVRCLKLDKHLFSFEELWSAGSS